jgi:hypothetical protein
VTLARGLVCLIDAVERALKRSSDCRLIRFAEVEMQIANVGSFVRCGHLPCY